jgi:hypothetical protein
MSADPLNANPTILSASDLPTRRRRASSHSNVDAFSTLFSNGTAVPGHLSDPFTTSPVSLSDLESEDDAVVDRIDEQEIYGKLLFDIKKKPHLLFQSRSESSVVGDDALALKM